MNTQYWEEEIETMSREKLQELQLQRLKKTINIAANAPYYKEVFSKHNITADNIQSLDDIRKIPFTTKADMRANYPFGLVAGDMQNDGVRIHSSSGTTGNPTVIVHSQHDLDSWANLVARCLYTVGIRKTDVFQNSSGYGMFTGGLGFQYGAERLGCLTVPAAAGNSKRQIKFINDFKTTALHAIPSYAIRLAEVFQEEGLDPKGTTLKTLVIGAEPHTDEQRRKIERMLGVKAYNSFGMTEMNGPGVAFECQEQNGMHFWEDCYLVEIIDPETCEPVPEGEIGELVLTTLDREMMPLNINVGESVSLKKLSECPLVLNQFSPPLSKSLLKEMSDNGSEPKIILRCPTAAIFTKYITEGLACGIVTKLGHFFMFPSSLKNIVYFPVESKYQFNFFLYSHEEFPKELYSLFYHLLHRLLILG